MSALEINLPDVVAEVTRAFLRYDKALGENDIATLNELFWDDTQTVRFGMTENQYGYNAIASYRGGRGGAGVGRRLFNTVITTFGHDFATANSEFQAYNASRAGRQSQTWVRMPQGWRVTSSHVSFMNIPRM